MIVAHLIGGNEIEGISEGIVIINGNQLETSYEDLVAVCGNISLGDLDTTKDERYIRQDYIQSVREYSDGELGADFVDDNHLVEQICYSHYKVDFEKKTLKLTIDTYN